MGSGYKAVIAAATVLLAGAAAEAASAQTAKPRAGLVASDENRWGLQTPKKSLQFGSGRWGVNVNVEEPVGREVKAKDVEAGAFFRIAPSVKVGGSLRLDDKFSKPERVRPEDRDARVRLETKFQF